jgi:hypothetical protein
MLLRDAGKQPTFPVLPRNEESSIYKVRSASVPESDSSFLGRTRKRLRNDRPSGEAGTTSMNGNQTADIDNALNNWLDMLDAW